MPERIPGAASRSRAALPVAAHDRFAIRPDVHAPPDAGPDAYPEDTMDDSYDLLAVRIKRGTKINGAVVALCPDADGFVVADVCIDGPPVP